MMIRQDRAVTDFNEIVSIMSKCDVVRIAINGDDGYPYIVPLNFGMVVEDGQRVTLYFHSAIRGRKHDLIAKDNRASFEMDCKHQLYSDSERGYCTMYYESVIGRGTLEYIEDEELKAEALSLLTDRYHGNRHFEYNHVSIPRTSVYQLRVSEMIGKRKEPRQ